MGKCVDNEGEFVGNYAEPCEVCTNGIYILFCL